MKTFLTTLAVLFISIQGFAKVGMGGQVISIDPIVVRDVDTGTLRTYQLDSTKFSIYHDIISLHGAKSTGCGCGAKSLGKFEKPVSLHVESQGRKYLVTIPAHRTILFGDENGFQIDVKDEELGGVVSDEEGTKANQTLVFSEYAKLRQSTSGLLRQMAKATSEKNYNQARVIYSSLMENELYSEDIKKLTLIYKSIPEFERPINTFTRDIRPWMRDLSNTFGGVNFDKMTLSEYMNFVDDWASKPFAESNLPRRGGSESYFTMYFDEFGVPQETQVDIFIKIIEVRLRVLLAVAKSGADWRKVDVFRDDRNADEAFEDLKYGKSERGRAYAMALKYRLLAEDSKVQDFLGHTSFGRSVMKKD